MRNELPYWRLSAFYLFYFAALGTLVPYWSLYLKGLGFGAREIGELMAIVMLTKVVAPHLWGWLADHLGRRLWVIRAGALMAVGSFSLIFFVDQFWSIAWVMFAFSFFWNAVLPQFESLTLNLLGRHSDRYSQVRMWGSIGFICAVVLLGELLEWAPLILIPTTLAIIYGAIFLSTLTLDEGEGGAPGEGEPMGRLLRRPAVLALLAAATLMQTGHGPYYTFYTLYLEGYGYSRGVIGQLWALGVLAEVGLFLIMHRLIARFGLRRLLLASFLLTGGRWLLIGLMPEVGVVIVAAQLLHAASFGVFHASAIALVHRYFRGRSHGKGQALYNGLCFGGGGALGSYFSGIAWEGVGPLASYTIASALTFVGAFLVWRWVEEGSPVQPAR